jgi:hypothetical protein
LVPSVLWYLQYICLLLIIQFNLNSRYLRYPQTPGVNLEAGDTMADEMDPGISSDGDGNRAKWRWAVGYAEVLAPLFVEIG